jgi:hypothetical protein
MNQLEPKDIKSKLNKIPLNKKVDFKGWVIIKKWSNRYKKPFIHAFKEVKAMSDKGENLGFKDTLHFRENTKGKWVEVL